MGNQQNKIPEVGGTMSISYSVDCPHCKYFIDDYHDRDWWDENIFMDEGPDGFWEVECPKCGKEFNIDGFEP